MTIAANSWLHKEAKSSRQKQETESRYRKVRDFFFAGNSRCLPFTSLASGKR
jgi:hypothetical protein